MMEVIDALSKGGLICTLLIDLLDVALKFAQEGLSQVVVDEDIVSTNAKLATIHKSKRSHFVSSVIQIAVLIDDEWALATKLEDARH